MCPACYIHLMTKARSSTSAGTTTRPKAEPSATTAGRIRSAATKPVKTTLSDIRRAVRKSFKEHPAALDA